MVAQDIERFVKDATKNKAWLSRLMSWSATRVSGGMQSLARDQPCSMGCRIQLESSLAVNVECAARLLPSSRPRCSGIPRFSLIVLPPTPGACLVCTG